MHATSEATSTEDRKAIIEANIATLPEEAQVFAREQLDKLSTENVALFLKMQDEGFCAGYFSGCNICQSTDSVLWHYKARSKEFSDSSPLRIDDKAGHHLLGLFQKLYKLNTENKADIDRACETINTFMRRTRFCMPGDHRIRNASSFKFTREQQRRHHGLSQTLNICWNRPEQFISYITKKDIPLWEKERLETLANLIHRAVYFKENINSVDDATIENFILCLIEAPRDPERSESRGYSQAERDAFNAARKEDWEDKAREYNIAEKIAQLKDFVELAATKEYGEITDDEIHLFFHGLKAIE